MRKLILGVLMLGAGLLHGQQKQKIAINNSLIAVTVEASSISTTIQSEGDSKYYSLRKGTYGGVQLGNGSGFSAGTNIEINLIKNSRRAFLSTGVHYIQHGGEVFISQGANPNSIFEYWAKRTSDKVGNLKISSLRIPLSLNFNVLTVGKKKNMGIGIEFGVHGYYNFNAKAVPDKDALGESITADQDASEAVRKFYYSMFGGVKLKYGRIYGLINISFMNPKNIWTDYYGTETDTKESWQTLGVGFYFVKNRNENSFIPQNGHYQAIILTLIRNFACSFAADT